jgi:PAS domain S-box-containing protein
MSQKHQSIKSKGGEDSAKNELDSNGITFKQLFEVLPDAVVVTDTRGKIRFANNQIEKMFGYKLEELWGEPVERLIPVRFKEHKKQRDAYIAHPRLRPMGSDLELYALRKEGVEFPVEIGLSPLETPDGNFVVAIIRDVTPRILAGQDLKRSEARNRALLEAIPDLMFRVHRDGTIWDYKVENAEDLYISPDSFLGKKLSETLPQDVAGQAMDAIERVVETGKRQAFEYKLSLANGTRYFEAWIAPSTPDEFVFVIRDITELEQVEQRHRTTLDNMLEGCQIIGFDWRYIYVNDAVARQGRKKPEELLHRTMMEAYPGIENTDMFRVLQRCMEERLRDSMENEFTFPDGAVGWFELRIQPVPEGLFILSLDITRRKQAEVALRASEDRYRDLVENSQDLICTHDLEGRILTVNPYAGRILGHSTDDLLQMNLRDILVPEALDVFDAYLSEIQNHGSAEGLMLVRTKSGEQRIWEYKNTLRTEGVVTPIVRGIARDVTVRKQYEEALQEEKERFTRLAATAPGLICSFRMRPDGSTSMPYASPTIEDVYGLKAEELVNDFSPAFARIHSDDVAHISETIAESARTMSPWKAEYRFNHPQKGEVWIEGHSMPVLEPDGSIIWHGFIIDITERKHAEMEIQLRADRLKGLRNIDIAISNSLDLKLVLNVILNEVQRQLGCDASDVLLLERYSQVLEFASGYGFQNEKGLRVVKLRLGEGIAGRVALERKPIHEPDLGQCVDISIRKPLFEDERFITYFGVPLITKGDLTGVLEVFHRSPFVPEPEWLEFLEAVAGQAAIAIDNAILLADLKRSNQDLILAYDQTLEGWSAALDLRDKETEGHTQRVTEMTLRLSEKMGVSKQDLVHVRRGALLHDIGKMGIPDRILLKPGKLTEEEWEHMRKHPVYAYELLKPISYLKPALDIPYCHHEKLDGSGYPRGLKGEEIPLSARIFAIVDVYDALTSDRPYRVAWSNQKTLEHILSLRGSHFDPAVVDVFQEFLQEE